MGKRTLVKPRKQSPSQESEGGGHGNAETFSPCRRPVFPVKYWVSAAGKFPVVSEDDMLRKTINEAQNRWWVLAKANVIGEGTERMQLMNSPRS